MKPRCTQCELHRRAKNIRIPGRTLGSSDILIVCEAPGKNEDEQNKVLIGRAGRKLDWLCGKAGIQDCHRRTNAVRCFPSGTPRKVHIDACRPWLVKEIDRYRPKVIVTSGAVATKSVLDLSELTKHRGFWFWYDGIPVIPTFHPADCLRKWQHDEIVIRDLKEAKRVADGGKVPNYHTIVNRQEILVVGRDVSAQDMMRDLRGKKRLAFDSEFTHIDFTKGEVLCWSLCAEPNRAYVLPVRDQEVMTYQSLMTLFQSKKIEKVGQVAIKDWCYFRLNVQQYFGKKQVQISPYVIDCAYAHSILNENLPHNLTFLQQWYGIDFGPYDSDVDFYKRNHLPGGFNRMTQVGGPELWLYAGLDAICTFRVAELLEKELRESGLYERPFRSWKMNRFRDAVELEFNGVPISKPYLLKTIKSTEHLIQSKEKGLAKIVGDAGFNPNSTPQVGQALLDLHLLNGRREIKRTGTGRVSVDKKTMEELAKRADHPFPKEIVEYRHLKKFLSTYYRPMYENLSSDGKYRTDVNGHTVVTHRFSSFIHTMPREAGAIREAICAPPGTKLVYADYKQLELRGIALISGDQRMLQDFREGRDPLRIVSSQVYRVPEDDVTTEQRHRGKTVVYGLNYVRTAKAIARDFDLDLGEVEKLVRAYFQRYPRLYQWMRETIRFVEHHGYVKIPGGFIRRFPSIEWAKKDQREDGDFFDDLGSMTRSGENAPIQGGCNWIVGHRNTMLQKLVRQHRKQEYVQYILGLHDSVTYLVQESEVAWFSKLQRETLEWKNCKMGGRVVDFPVDQKIVQTLAGV